MSLACLIESLALCCHTFLFEFLFLLVATIVTTLPSKAEIRYTNIFISKEGCGSRLWHNILSCLFFRDGFLSDFILHHDHEENVFSVWDIDRMRDVSIRSA